MKKLALIVVLVQLVFSQHRILDHKETFTYGSDGVSHHFKADLNPVEEKNLLLFVPSDELCENKIKAAKNEYGYSVTGGSNRYRNDKLFATSSFLNDSYIKQFPLKAQVPILFEYNEMCRSNWVEPKPFMLEDFVYDQLTYVFFAPDSMELLFFFQNDSTVYTLNKEVHKKGGVKYTLKANYAEKNQLFYQFVPKGITDVGAFTAQKYLEVLDTITPLAQTHLKQFPVFKEGMDTLDFVFQVQEHIVKSFYYLDQENGNGGYIPRNPNVVCTRKAGDCKDFSLLVHQVLKAYGIPSELVMSRANEYDSIVFPCKDMFNHVFTIYHHQGTKYYLDLTDKAATKGNPSRHTESTYYLSTLSGKVAKVDAIPNSGIILTRTLHILQSENIILGNDTIGFSGALAYDLNYYQYESDQQEIAQNLIKTFRKGDENLAYVNINDSLIKLDQKNLLIQNWKTNTNLINGYQNVRYLDYKKLINTYPLFKEQQSLDQIVTFKFHQKIKAEGVDEFFELPCFKMDVKGEQIDEYTFVLKYYLQLKKHVNEECFEEFNQVIKKIKPLKYELD